MAVTKAALASRRKGKADMAAQSGVWDRPGAPSHGPRPVRRLCQVEPEHGQILAGLHSAEALVKPHGLGGWIRDHPGLAAAKPAGMVQRYRYQLRRHALPPPRAC